MNKALLIILDGFGCRKESEGNAILNANKPFINQLLHDYPYTEIQTSGEAVGLAKGQMGNSEVGHVNIGSGRIIYQDSVRINKSIESGDFFANQVLVDAFDLAKSRGSNIHMIGLVSDGGVHSHQRHLHALIDMAAERDFKDVFVHAFTDGRDTAPNSGKGFIQSLEDHLKTKECGKIATISGRYYAMDRDKRWERIEQAYQALHGNSEFTFASSTDAMQAAYDRGETDEFIQPTLIAEQGQPVASINSDDVIISFNYRSDRLRQMSRALADPEFKEFDRNFESLDFVQFTNYDANFELPTVFDAQTIDQTLGEIISKLGVKQLRAAETEKYAHVTFFFNGGIETIFENEDRILVDSPKVATYDLQPEMSAYELTDRLKEAVKSDQYQLIVCNYANSDMVGHTGDYKAAVKAIETLDDCLNQLISIARDKDYQVIITADHGNSEQMLDDENKMPFTQHTTGPVPLIMVSGDSYKLKNDGRLCDVAPTILDMMNIDKPAAMTGHSLIDKE